MKKERERTFCGIKTDQSKSIVDSHTKNINIIT